MHRRIVVTPMAWAVAVILLALAGATGRAQEASAPAKPAQAATPLGSAFNYQGFVKNISVPYNGTYDFRFIVYDVPTAGARVSGTPILSIPGITVSNGYFSTALDFGQIFTSSSKRFYLNIELKKTGTSTYTTITPRAELLPAPQAYYAKAAQNVSWSGVIMKPEAIFKRRIYVPGAGFGHQTYNSNFSGSEYGLTWTNCSDEAGFVVPKPSDWDVATTFSVTLYFALPLSTANKVVRWRLHTIGTSINLPAASAATGWDSLSYQATEDAAPLNVYTASGHSYMVKSHTWTPKWDAYYHDWYFGSGGVTGGNSFGDNPIWRFNFQRGAAIANGETYTDDMVVLGASIDYTAVH